MLNNVLAHTLCTSDKGNQQETEPCERLRGQENSKRKQLAVPRSPAAPGPITSNAFSSQAQVPQADDTKAVTHVGRWKKSEIGKHKSSKSRRLIHRLIQRISFSCFQRVKEDEAAASLAQSEPWDSFCLLLMATLTQGKPQTTAPSPTQRR